jgi:hypothetical protein
MATATPVTIADSYDDVGAWFGRALGTLLAIVQSMLGLVG